MELGDVFWADLPSSNGREQAGLRPVIVLQTRAASSRLPTVLTVPLTTALQCLRFPGTCLIEPSAANGLLSKSAALVFQLRALDIKRLRQRIGELEDAELEEIFRHLDLLLGR